MKTLPTLRLATCVAALALGTAACGGDGGSSATGGGSSSGGSIPSGVPADGGSFTEVLEAEAIPSQDVADAAAEEAITPENADAEFEALKAEIEGDG